MPSGCRPALSAAVASSYPTASGPTGDTEPGSIRRPTTLRAAPEAHEDATAVTVASVGQLWLHGRTAASWCLTWNQADRTDCCRLWLAWSNTRVFPYAPHIGLVRHRNRGRTGYAFRTARKLGLVSLAQRKARDIAAPVGHLNRNRVGPHRESLGTQVIDPLAVG